MRNALVIGFVVLFVITLGLIAYGVITHKEEGLLAYCWKGNTAVYVKPAEGVASGVCEDPVLWVWDELPVKVIGISIVRGNASEEQQRSLTNAVELINDQIGKRVVVEVADPADADVVVEWDHAYEVGDRPIPGECSHIISDGSPRGLIRMRGVSNIRYQYRILIHELGHCALGLADDHNGDDNNIMRNPVLNDAELDRMLFDRFSDDDRSLVRETYKL